MQTNIPSRELRTGMYVADLDRPWIDTPFLFQGFVIENDEQIGQLQEYCKFVLVDSLRSTQAGQAAIAAYVNKAKSGMQGSAEQESASDFDRYASAFDERNVNTVRPAFIPDNIEITTYRDVNPVEAELAPAEEAYARTGEILHDLMQDIQSGKDLAIQEVETVVQDVVDSMVRNPDALMLIARMRREDEVIYGHGLNVAIYLVALGRHLGLPKDFLERLGVVGLLLDIGKIKLPRELLLKNEQLTSEEFETIKEHVNHSLDILSETPNLHPDIVQGIAQHHERENGSGYPAGISKGNISLFGRMAAIADTFSALTNPRPYAEAAPAYEALHAMSNWGDEFYHASMVEQFIHAIGVFPVGSMVELSSGEVAVVISHSKVRRLKPRVLIISGPDKSPLPHPATVDLLYQAATHEPPRSILRGLPSGAYGLDAREYYLA